jgi:hypothetical protein
VGVVGHVIHCLILEGFVGHALMVHGWMVHGKNLVNFFCGFWWDGVFYTRNVLAIRVPNISNSAKIGWSSNHNVTDREIYILCLLRWDRIGPFQYLHWSKIEQKQHSSWIDIELLFVNKCVWIINIDFLGLV